MATVFTGTQAEDVNPVPSIHSAGEVHVAEGKYDTLGSEVVDDIIKLHKIPAGCIPIDCRLECDELDSGTAVVVELALMELGASDVLANSQMILASTVAQAGGVVRMDQLSTAVRAVLEVSVDVQRFVALKITTGATGAQVGRIKSSVLFRAAEYNE